VLAGGLGTRLRDIVTDVPKPMAPINNRPFLEYLFERLFIFNVEKVILSVGYKSQCIFSHFNNSYKNIDIVYCKEDAPLGTGGALLRSLSLTNSDQVLVLNGDTFMDLDLFKLKDFSTKTSASVMVLRQVDDTTRYGRVEIHENNILSIKQSVKGSGLINAGAYVIRSNFFKQFDILEDSFSLEKDILPLALEAKLFDGFVHNGLFIDIGIPDDFYKAKKLLT